MIEWWEEHVDWLAGRASCDDPVRHRLQLLSDALPEARTRIGECMNIMEPRDLERPGMED
jgi:hypothetical protein